MTATRSVRTAPALPEPVPDGFGPPPRPRPARNLAGILLGMLLVAFCAVGVAAYTASVGHRRPVLVIARPVNAGSVIHDADLGEAQLPPDPALRTVPASQRSRVVGRVAGVNLVPGTLLAEGELATGPSVDGNHAVVGLALKAGQFPAALRALDAVTVVETSPASSLGPTGATILVDNAVVVSTDQAPDAQTTIVSVLVPRPAAPSIAGAAARGQISVVLVGQAGSAGGSG